jgi:hypothetical protein
MLPATGVPDETHLAHMGLTDTLFRDADNGRSFPIAWREFLDGCTAPVTIAAWNTSTLELLARTTDAAEPRVSLKSAYRAIYGKGAAGLEEVVAQRGLTAEANPFRGRAGLRLANAVAVVRHLHARTLV